jgi:hypothetical protein
MSPIGRGRKFLSPIAGRALSTCLRVMAICCGEGRVSVGVRELDMVVRFKWFPLNAPIFIIIIMSEQLNFYSLPYTAEQPPPELFHEIEMESECSDIAAFNTGLEERDLFLGKRKCVVCGTGILEALENCHIIGHSDHEMVCYV